MPIEFHCEHCEKLVNAPDDAGGRRAQCPHCKGKCYVPTASDQLEEIPLAPLDQEEEKRRKQAHQEDVALQQSLLHERADLDAPAKPASQASTTASPAQATTIDAKGLVYDYVEAMSGGRLEEADRIADRLLTVRDDVLRIIESIATDPLAASDMPAVPKPVLVGFLKQLRARL